MSKEDFERHVAAFFDAKRIAVWGIEEGRVGPGIWVAKRLAKKGAQVIGVNPAFAEEDPVRVRSLVGLEPPVDAALLYVDPPDALRAAEDCIAANVPLVWLHDAMSPGAATTEVVERLRAAGTTVIPGLCPMLYLRPADPAHFCLRWVLRWKGKVARVQQATGATT